MRLFINILNVLYSCVSWKAQLLQRPGYRLNGWGTSVWFPVGARDSSLLHRIQTSSGAHQTAYLMGTGGSFAGGKVLTTHLHLVPRLRMWHMAVIMRSQKPNRWSLLWSTHSDSRLTSAWPSMESPSGCVVEEQYCRSGLPGDLDCETSYLRESWLSQYSICLQERFTSIIIFIFIANYMQ
jgi:hypothetical protein